MRRPKLCTSVRPLQQRYDLLPDSVLAGASILPQSGAGALSNNNTAD